MKDDAVRMPSPAPSGAAGSPSIDGQPVKESDDLNALVDQSIHSIVQDSYLVRHIDDRLTGYTSDATAAFVTEIKQYIESLDMRAKERSRVERAEVTLSRHVGDAIGELRGKDDKDKLKNLADWVKRAGFLFIGLAAQQFVVVYRQPSIEFASVIWLAAFLVLAMSLVGYGAKLDSPLAFFRDKKKVDGASSPKEGNPEKGKDDPSKGPGTPL